MKFSVSGSKLLPHIGLYSVTRQTDRRILVVLMALIDKVRSRTQWGFVVDKYPALDGV
jgi:hypothetical protein